EAVELYVIRAGLVRSYAKAAHLRLRHVDGHPDTRAGGAGGCGVDGKAALERHRAARDLRGQRGTQVLAHRGRAQARELEVPVQGDRLRADRAGPLQPPALADGGAQLIASGRAAGGAEVAQLEGDRIEIEPKRRR